MMYIEEMHTALCDVCMRELDIMARDQDDLLCEMREIGWACQECVHQFTQQSTYRVVCPDCVWEALSV